MNDLELTTEQADIVIDAVIAFIERVIALLVRS